MVQILQLFVVLDLLLVSMLEENGSCLRPRPLDLSAPVSLLLLMVLKFCVLSKNATISWCHSLCVL